jgi:hypothetical protein
VTTDAVDGLPFPPDSSASQSQNPAGSSVAVKKPRRLAGQATKVAKSGVPNPDSKALDVQLHEALLHGHSEDSHRVHSLLDFITFFLRKAPTLDYNLRQKIIGHCRPNGEEAGRSSSRGNLAESSDSTHDKRKEQWVSKNFPGVRQRNNKFGTSIRRRVPKVDIWLGTYKTAEAAAQARGAAANWLATWLATHSGSKLLNDEERDELMKCAKKAGGHLSDDRSHHNVASPDPVENLEEKATTSASLEGKAVANEEHVSQWESPAHENFSSEEHVSQRESLAYENFSSEEHVSQREFPAHANFLLESVLDNHSPELNLDNCFRF